MSDINSRPIGLDSVCNGIERIAKIPVFKDGMIKPDHFIIPLNPGNGRTTLLEYMVDTYKQNGILSFNCGYKEYLEITLDGSPSQLKDSFNIVKSEAIYSNHYSGVVSIDFSKIALHLNETQHSDFLTGIKEISSFACVVFFTNETTTRNEELLISEIIKEVGPNSIQRFEFKPFTDENLASIMLKKFGDFGFRFASSRSILKLFKAIVPVYGISTIKDAIMMAEHLGKSLKYNTRSILTENMIKSAISNITTKERSLICHEK